MYYSKKEEKVKNFFRNFSKFFGEAFYEVKNLELLKKSTLFTLGGGVYVGLEMLWRGRSHISMFAAGGICFLLLGKLRRIPGRLILGPAVITAVELATGLLVNRDYGVWDYRSVPGNFLGQICPLYTLLWLPVSLAGMGLYSLAERVMEDLSR